jgi:lactoylglutathione lyase
MSPAVQAGSSRLSHTCLLVRDLQRSLAFYALLGFEERRSVGTGERKSVFCGLPGDNDRLQLGLAPNFNPGMAQFGHVAVNINDLDDVLRLLAEHGLAPDRAPIQGADARICFVRDPDGYAIELLEEVDEAA